MAMETQFQIRQNAMEVQDYLKDLFDWQKSQKQKDKELQQVPEPAGSQEPSGSGAAEPVAVPAPRGRAITSSISAAPVELQAPGLTVHKKDASQSKPATAATKKKKMAGGGHAGSNAAAHTHSSYSKWDKLDVDAMLASDSEQSGGEEEEEEEQQPAQQAAVPMQGPGASAASIVPAPRAAANISTTMPARAATQPPITSNSRPGSVQAPQHPPIRNSEPQTADAWKTRGNDLFKAGQYAYAKECYARCADMDPNNAVAYANKAMAELKLQEWASAEEDCTHALQLDPAYVKALHRRGTARKHQAKHLDAAQDYEDALRLEPNNASVQGDRDAALNAYYTAAKLQPPTKRVRLQVSIAAAPPPPPPSAPAPPSSTVSAASQPIATKAGAPSQPNVLVPAHEQAGTSTLSSPSAAAASSSSPTGSQGGATPTAATRARVAAAAAVAAQQLSERLALSAKAPKTSTEFEASWRGLKGELGAQASYLSLLQPSQLPTVFKSSLTPQVLAGILRTVLSCMAGQVAAAQGGAQGEGQPAASAHTLGGPEGLELLQGLSKVPRVEMAAMCIGSKEKGELGGLWKAAIDAQGLVGDAGAEKARGVFKLPAV